MSQLYIVTPLPHLYAEYIMWNASLDEAQAGINIAGEISRKMWLKTQHSKNKFMASGPITLWQIDEEKVETVSDFISLGFRIPAITDYSHEIKRCLLFERKAMTDLAY